MNIQRIKWLDYRGILPVAGLAFGLGLVGAPAHANFILYSYSTAATVDGAASNTEAMFSLTGTTLTLTLTNSGITNSNGGLLDGLFFDIDGGGVTNIASQQLPAAVASTLYTSKSASTSNANVTGAWQFIPNVGGSSKYGLAAVGGSGLFSGAFSLGNGSDDYGILGSNTNMSTTSVNKFPLASGSTTFTIDGFTGTSVANVTFYYNSALSTSLAGTAVTGTLAPEQASLAVIMVGFIGLAAAGRRRRYNAGSI